MKYISKNGAHKVWIRPKRQKAIALSSGEIVKETDFGLKLQFTPIGGHVNVDRQEGFTTDLLPVKDRKAKGVLDTASEAKRLKMDEDEIIRILDRHPGNVANEGSDFARVDADSHPVDPEKYIVPEGDMMYCRLCRVHLDRRGAHMHQKKKEHLELLRQAESTSLASIGVS